MNCILDLLNKDEYDKYIELKQYNKNEIIFSEGLVCNYIGVVLEGQLLISTITLNDKEEVINIINKNCVFGNNLIFSSSPIFLGNIISQTNSRIAFISRNNLKLIFKDNKEFLYKYMELLSDQILRKRSRQTMLCNRLAVCYSTKGNYNRFRNDKYASIHDSTPSTAISSAA